MDDKTKWNNRYMHNNHIQAPCSLVQTYAQQSNGNQALDIACGLGRHSRYLSSCGFYIDAKDISDVAIASLEDVANIDAQVVDFTRYQFKKNHYDLVVCTYYLERSLFPKIQNSLKSGGLFIFETFLYHQDNEKAPKNKAFLLQQGELARTFSKAYEIIHLKEWWDKDQEGYKTMKGSLVARKH